MMTNGAYHVIICEKSEDTKGVIRICQSKKNRQYNEQKIKDKPRSTNKACTYNERSSNTNPTKKWTQVLRKD